MKRAINLMLLEVRGAEASNALIKPRSRMKDEILTSWVLSFSFTRLFTTSNAINPTTSAQNHSRKRNVSLLTTVFLAVRPHKLILFAFQRRLRRSSQQMFQR